MTAVENFFCFEWCACVFHYSTTGVGKRRHCCCQTSGKKERATSLFLRSSDFTFQICILRFVHNLHKVKNSNRQTRLNLFTFPCRWKKKMFFCASCCSHTPFLNVCKWREAGKRMRRILKLNEGGETTNQGYCSEVQKPLKKLES